MEFVYKDFFLENPNESSKKVLQIKLVKIEFVLLFTKIVTWNNMLFAAAEVHYELIFFKHTNSFSTMFML